MSVKNRFKKTQLTLRAGPLNMVFDSETGWLRNMRLGRHEVMRAVYGAVRDPHWNTIEPRITLLDRRVESDQFQLTFKAVCQSNDIQFEWIGNLMGESDGTIRFRFEGEAKSAFSKNRIGLCLLHPAPECAGKPCRVQHTDGSVEVSKFPSDISPHQPFKDMSMISHQVASGIEAEVTLEGDVFEMEDQRNWTDASFKTYSTPLEHPFPVRMRQGDKVEQAVRLTVKGDALDQVAELRDADCLDLDTSYSAEPIGRCIGLGMTTPVSSHDEQAVARLKALELDHLRADVHLSQSTWKQQVREAAQLAASTATKLHLAVYADSHPEDALSALVGHLQAESIEIELLLLFHEDPITTDAAWIETAKTLLQQKGLAIPIAAGTDAYFAELNRHPESAGTDAFPCYSINPQVHAFDDLSLMENLEGQVSTVDSAGKLFDRPVVISPVTLKPRCNRPALEEARGPVGGPLPAHVDPRQSTLFAAAWTVGSLANLLPNAKVHSLTYFETIGSQGVMERMAGSKYPGVFKSVPGGVFPVYHVFRDLAGYSKVALVHTDDTPDLACLELVQDDQRRFIVANLSVEPVHVDMHLESQCVRLRIMDPDNVQMAMEEPEAFRNSYEDFVIPNENLHLYMESNAIATIDLIPIE